MLWVRPVFTLKDGRLNEIQAKDFDSFVKVQNKLIQSEFGGTRMRRRTGLVTLAQYRNLAKNVKVSAVVRLLTRDKESSPCGLMSISKL